MYMQISNHGTSGHISPFVHACMQWQIKAHAHDHVHAQEHSVPLVNGSHIQNVHRLAYTNQDFKLKCMHDFFFLEALFGTGI